MWCLSNWLFLYVQRLNFPNLTQTMSMALSSDVSSSSSSLPLTQLLYCNFNECKKYQVVRDPRMAIYQIQGRCCRKSGLLQSSNIPGSIEPIIPQLFFLKKRKNKHLLWLCNSLESTLLRAAIYFWNYEMSPTSILQYSHNLKTKKYLNEVTA